MFRFRKTFLYSVLLLFSCQLASQSLVVNSGTQLESVTLNAARAIFSMRLKQWPDGFPITVYVLSDTSEIHRDFTRNKLLMFPHQLRRSWDRYVYSGMGIAPIELKTEQEMMEKVASTPGAIGYLSKEFKDDRVRAITIQ
ncbi:MAG: hypothetical protein HRU20_27310 [Pseudomonadales bacterium]|nr:hypothetical protein [Pseudomonadales bacterium]